MSFQILDDRKQCFGLYIDGKFHYDKPPKNLDGTWTWTPHLTEHDVEYAHIWTAGREPNEVGPVHLRDRYEVRSRKIKAFLKKFI